MNETKRFLIGDAGELIDLDNHKFIDYGDECCKILNELNDENEQLKIFLKALNEELSLANRDNDTLEEENEQLKSTIAQLIEQNRKNNDLLLSDIRILEKEIKGIKKRVYEVMCE